MKEITDLLAVFGRNLPQIVIGCVEGIAAVVLLGSGLQRKRKKEKRSSFSGAEAVFLDELGHEDGTSWLMLRVEDKMPVYVGENLEKTIGVTYEKLQEDVTCLRKVAGDVREANHMWSSYLSWNGDTPFTLELQHQNGRWFQIRIERCGNQKYDLFCFRDITEQYEKEESYKKELLIAQEESRSKTTFLSQMSHEIRTPMNGIMGMLALARGKLTDDHPAMQYLSKAGELSDHLLSLINDILDMSRIEAGKVELECKAFSLRKLGEHLYDMFAKTLEVRGIHYEVKFQDVTVDYVKGDELRISQVIINFLSNAVKFTKTGEITVTFRQMMLQDGKADLMICVHDTGIGMKADFINRIFRPFEQEDEHITKEYGGSGLGMAITDNLVRLMGGEIVVKSKLGEGSDFTVFLNLPIAEPGEEDKSQELSAAGENRIGTKSEKTEENTTDNAEPDENAFRGCRILLAEDNEINALVAVEFITGMGAEVEVAENGQIAVEKFASHPENYYDFILMDVQMPVMDGRTAARTIRAMERPDAESILIFALSADAFTEDERLSLESGMNGHYIKPVDFEALQRSVGVFLREKQR